MSHTCKHAVQVQHEASVLRRLCQLRMRCHRQLLSGEAHALHKQSCSCTHAHPDLVFSRRLHMSCGLLHGALEPTVYRIIYSALKYG